MEPIKINKISQLAGKYDVFIFSIFGILHDGEFLIPKAVDILQRLSENQKHTFFLSNAPQRSDYIKDQLNRLGIDKSLYHGILTAGDQVHRSLKMRETAWHSRLGKRCYFVGDQTMEDVLPTPEYQRTNNITEADFILLSGPENSNKKLSDYLEVLDKASRRSIPMVCGNPDISVSKRFSVEIRAGQLAAAYQSMGGDVFFHGKPHEQTYDALFSHLKGFKKERMLIIGDSIVTDVAGTNGLKLPSLLTLSLTTLNELSSPSTVMTFDRLCTLIAQLKNPLYVPTYICFPLKW